MKNLSIKKCLDQLKTVPLPFAEMAQLESLVRELGYLGAIEYLQWKDYMSNPIVERNQPMADRHRAILEGME